MPRDEMDELDLEEEDEEEEDDLDYLDDLDDEGGPDDLDDDEEDEEDVDEEEEADVPVTSKAGLVTEEDGWDVVDLDEDEDDDEEEDEDEEEEDGDGDDADEDEEDEEDEEVDTYGDDEEALLGQPKHRMSATEQKKRSGPGADARKSAASAAGSTTNSRLNRNLKTSVGKRTVPRSNRRVRAAKLETKPNPSQPTAGLSPKNRSLNKRASSSRRK